MKFMSSLTELMAENLLVFAKFEKKIQSFTRSMTIL